MRNQKIKNPKGKIFQGGAKIEGKYANYFKVGYNAFEFLFDFGQQYSETEEGKLYTRIVTSPCYAKSLTFCLPAELQLKSSKFNF